MIPCGSRRHGWLETPKRFDVPVGTGWNCAVSENSVPPKWFIMVYHGLSWFIIMFRLKILEISCRHIGYQPHLGVFLGDMKVLDLG